MMQYILHPVTTATDDLKSEARLCAACWEQTIEQLTYFE
jgi:hypothetical protein